MHSREQIQSHTSNSANPLISLVVGEHISGWFVSPVYPHITNPMQIIQVTQGKDDVNERL